MAYTGIDLNIPVADVDSVIGTAANKFDSIRLYRAASRGGTYSLLATITLVSGDTVYTYSDASGATSSWYKVTFFNSITSNETSLTETEPFPAARDILTLKELRQKIVKRLAGKVLTPISFTAQSTVVTALIDTAADSEWYEGWHLYRPDATTSADYDRRVSAYTPATGALSHGGSAYNDTVITAEQVEICPLDIDYDLLLELVNDGLLDTRWLYRLELGMTSGQMQYALPNFVEGEEYIKQIWRRFGGTAGSYIWKPIEMNGGFARVHGSNFKCTLDVDPSIGENEVIAIEVWRPGEILDGETDFTAVQRLWAEAAAMVSVIEYVADQQVIRHQESAIAGLLPKWKERKRMASRKYGPTPIARIQPLSRISGLPDV